MTGNNASAGRNGRITSRRRILALTGTTAVGGLAGCSGILGGDGSGDGDDGGDESGESTTEGDGTPTDGDSSPDPPAASVSPSDCEPETIDADIESDTTWSTGECPRVALDGNIRVLNGATLTIEPGVEVVGRSGSKLTIKSEGTLQSNGEAGNPVLFYGDSQTKGYWETIEIESSNDNRLSWTVVRDAGGGNWANVWVQGSGRLTVENSTFANSATWGLVVEDGATLPSYSNNRSTANETAALRVATTLLGSLDAESIHTGNDGDDWIEVPAADVESDATWPAPDVPYYFDGNHRLFSAVSVDPGAQVRFSAGSKLTVKSEGSLTAEGTSDAPIAFTGADGTPGYWETIEFESNNADNVLRYVEVADAGGGNWANVWVQGSGRLTVENSTFANSATWGLVVEDGATLPSFASNTFSGNGTAALRVATTLLGSLDAASTYADGNENDWIEVPSADVESDATWPAPDAPYYFDGNHRLFSAVSVDPGATFQFSSGSKLTVKSEGSLNAEGTSDAPIAFTGADGTPGYWETIEFESNNSDNVFRNAEVADAGGGNWANVWVQGSARLTLESSTLRNSATFGIVVEDGAAFDGSGNVYQNNGEGGIRNENN
jgi:hypothetical protein